MEQHYQTQGDAIYVTQLVQRLHDLYLICATLPDRDDELFTLKLLQRLCDDVTAEGYGA